MAPAALAIRLCAGHVTVLTAFSPFPFSLRGPAAGTSCHSASANEPGDQHRSGKSTFFSQHLGACPCPFPCPCLLAAPCPFLCPCPSPSPSPCLYPSAACPLSTGPCLCLCPCRDPSPFLSFDPGPCLALCHTPCPCLAGYRPFACQEWQPPKTLMTSQLSNDGDKQG